MTRPPLGDRVEALALVDHMREVDTSEPDDLDTGGLDNCHGVVPRIDYHRTMTRYWERAVLQSVFTQKAYRRHLVATENSRHQCVPKGPGKGKFCP
jgi:hypothetical protein